MTPEDLTTPGSAIRRCLPRTGVDWKQRWDGGFAVRQSARRAGDKSRLDYRPHPEELGTRSAQRAADGKRLEGWTRHVDSRPSFETLAPDSASALPERAPQDEVW